MGNFFGFCLEFCQSAFHIFQYFLKECILIFFFKEKAKADETLSTTTPSPTEAEDNETSQETTAGWCKNPVIWILITVVLAGLLLVYNKKKKDQK